MSKILNAFSEILDVSIILDSLLGELTGWGLIMAGGWVLFFCVVLSCFMHPLKHICLIPFSSEPLAILFSVSLSRETFEWSSTVRTGEEILVLTIRWVSVVILCCMVSGPRARLHTQHRGDQMESKTWSPFGVYGSVRGRIASFRFSVVCLLWIRSHGRWGPWRKQICYTDSFSAEFTVIKGMEGGKNGW